ncbi:AQG_2a_G0031760.mRNA.1.CDS.1 [Saccharomyces cerevisiae]|nr:ER membrane protein complex subunit 3 [Saccharomyces cerevisiae]CAI4564232.1 AMP_1a_G0031510.mRNA.1.CDS.1 [Saccharomyces cerevisiae]CAI4565153.1 CPA_1a_G0031790.mRNA.1.CDS.1 [Saccharomyces cerevisiae]CAI4569633.1 BFP_1a_G0031160.mRNA.1.CDS.1 [Saccharomyces cerevisiae]CAI4571395.1 BCN_G0032220.mRNA.1.CDS.1 [Saccharomyces cerevisiae]
MTINQHLQQLLFNRIDKTTSSIQQARAPQMLLDDQLKYWVLLPISIVMVLTGVLKQYIMTLITGSSANEAQPRVKLTEWQYLQWAQLLIGNGGNLSSDAFAAKKEFLVKDLTEERHLAKAKQQDGSQAGEVPNPFNDPNMSNAMMNMAKGNMASFIPQTIIMWWVNHFFAGFILMQLPFPLTAKFKEMLQTGIICQDLDVRWVSSISWYFISVLGLNPVYNLIGLNDQDMGIQAGIGGPQGPQGPPQSQVDKAMHAMANDLTIIQHETCLDNVEQRVLKQYM